jgi:MFS family permease
MSWLAYRLTHSAVLMGVIGFVGGIPALPLSPLAGVLADRVDRARLMKLTQSLCLAQAVALALLVATDAVQVWHLVALSIFLGIVTAFDTPVRMSLTVDLIDRKEDLRDAISMNATMNRVKDMVGPALGGILVAALGEAWCFALNALTFLPVLWALATIHIKPRPGAVLLQGHRAEMAAGFRYSFGFPPIRNVLLLLTAFAILGMNYQVLLPIFAEDIFHGGPRLLGFLRSAAGVGALVAMGYLVHHRSEQRLPVQIAGATAIFGASLMAFAWMPGPWLAAAMLALSGLAMTILTTGSNIFLQTVADEDKRGRVISFWTMAINGMGPFGCLLVGALPHALGVRATVALAGAGCLLAAGLFAKKIPEFMRKEHHDT